MKKITLRLFFTTLLVLSMAPVLAHQFICRRHDGRS
jgi:hypothetical protein